MTATSVPKPDKAADTWSAEETRSGGKKWALIGGLGTAAVLIGAIVGLYLLGGNDQSALEKLRDIAIIFIVLMSVLIVVLLAAITVALWFLLRGVKDGVVPMLGELTETARRVRGTTDFVTEEAVKPIVTVASSYARMRAMTRVVLFGPKKK